MTFFARDSYTGNGATTTYTVSFPYISQSHVKVYVDGVLKTVTTDYTWPSTSQIQFVAAPSNGAKIVITRASNQSARLVDFTQPSNLDEADLDLEGNQGFYIAQEAIDSAALAPQLDTDDKYNASSKIIKNVATPTSANDAVNKAYIDAIQIATGNVPTPTNPGDNTKVLQASSGTFSWGPAVSTFMATVLDDTTAAAARTTLGAQSDLLNVLTTNGDLLTRASGALSRVGIGATSAVLGVVSGAPVWIDALPRSYIAGLTLSNNSTDAVNDIDIAVGAAMDDGNAVMTVLSSAITKRLDASWAVGTNQGGLDTGTIGNNVYHMWLIRRPDTGVVDALFSLSATAPTMPTNYTQKRRIGSVIRSGATILAFKQVGDEFLLATPILDINVTNPGTAAVTRTLTVPTGVVVVSRLNVLVDATTSGNIVVYLSSLDTNDVAASATAAPLGQLNTTTSATWSHDAGMVLIRTNTSAQIRSRQSVSGASDAFRIATLGDRKSTRLNSSHVSESRMPSSA